MQQEEWNQQAIHDVAQMLQFCEDSEMLLELRQCDIPPQVFKAAARQLPREQQTRIRQWVAEQNAQRESVACSLMTRKPCG
jgi:DNA-binding FadR family transcriptional regulator